MINELGYPCRGSLYSWYEEYLANDGDISSKNPYRRYGITRSMSRKGCSSDSSAMEGFFGRLKVEFFYGRDWRGWSTGRFMEALGSYIEWYDEKRIKK